MKYYLLKKNNTFAQIKFKKMKKLVLLAIGITLFSCGKEKKTEAVEDTPEVVSKYDVIIDGIYEKNDSIYIQYKSEGYFLYDKPVTKLVKGGKDMQRITFNIPEGVTPENLQIIFSTNKEQEMLTIKNISVKNGDVEVFNGDNLKHAVYFNANPGFVWNEPGLNYKLNFDGQFPPGEIGNEKLEAILAK